MHDAAPAPIASWPVCRPRDGDRRFNRGDGPDMSASIRMIPPEEATGRLAELYGRVKKPLPAESSKTTPSKRTRAHRSASIAGPESAILWPASLENRGNNPSIWIAGKVSRCLVRAGSMGWGWVGCWQFAATVGGVEEPGKCGWAAEGWRARGSVSEARGGLVRAW